MRVIHLQKATGIGGSERHMLSLLPALAEGGIDVCVGVFGAGDYRTFVDELSAAGIDTFVVPAGRRVNLRLVPRLVRELKRVRPDIVHTHLIHADFYGQIAARALGVASVHSVHSGHLFYGKQPYRGAMRLGASLARRTIAVSHHIARFLQVRRIARKEKIRVIHHGIEAAGWSASAAEREEYRARFGLAPGDVGIGIASRLAPHKGHDLLLHAFEDAAKVDPRLQLKIAGDGPLRDELQRVAAASPSASGVSFLGYVRDVKAFIGACDIIALPSIPGDGEGFGLAALEGMAAGKAVIATATDSLPELIDDRHTGLLVPPEDIGALSAGLLMLARDDTLRGQLGAEARERVASDFSLQQMLTKTVQVYEEALSD